MPARSNRSVHVTISGRVQGVGFRWWTTRKAGALGIAGWVRNRLDGSVEAVFSGPPTAVAAMLKACEEGPMTATVSGVDVSDCEAPQTNGFAHRPTA